MYYSYCVRSIFVFFFKRSGAPRDLHSSPTRRLPDLSPRRAQVTRQGAPRQRPDHLAEGQAPEEEPEDPAEPVRGQDRKSTRLNSSHANISYAVFCLKKKKIKNNKQLNTIKT